jgi:uncharacterized protein YdbL (DUF1318 family)
MSRTFIPFVILPWLTACTFNFEVTTPRTALENQIMGSYKELEDDLILVSSVRSGGKQASAEMAPGKRRALDARENQEFNRDDIDELKDKGIVGETATGTVAILPKASGDGKDLRLAQQLVPEENRDREDIWKRIIESNENLSAKDLPEVRRTYAKLQRETARPGQWVQDEGGNWMRKEGAESIK